VRKAVAVQEKSNRLDNEYLDNPNHHGTPNMIQTLVNQKLVKIKNTGAGFFVELEDIK
jgi:hypothetical protein